MSRPNLGRRAGGLALLEVVAATALLGLITVGIFGAATFAVKAEQRRRQTLAAHEVANRLLIVALDDERNLPNPQAVYNDGQFDFRWELIKIPMPVTIPDKGVLEPPSQGQSAAITSHTKFMIMRVWASRVGSMGTAEVGGPLLAELRRAVSPMGIMKRNPDAIRRFTSDPVRALDYMSGLAGLPTAGGDRPSGTGGGAQPHGGGGGGGPAPRRGGGGGVSGTPWGTQ